jgi:hypothetical protein
LVEADPGFIVQARQAPINPPYISVNTGVGTDMGGTRVAVCLTGLEIDGSPQTLADGKSVSLPNQVTVLRKGSVYVISNPYGDVVQAQIAGGLVTITVVLGIIHTSNVRGLLGGADNDTHDIVMRDGTVLKKPVSGDQFHRYGESWRVAPADSIICGRGRVAAGMPTRQYYSDDLVPRERDRVRAICTAKGVKEGPLLDDCMLDVSLLKNSAADAFVHAPVPKEVIRPSP